MLISGVKCYTEFLWADANCDWSMARCNGQHCSCCRQETFSLGSFINAHIKRPVCSVFVPL